MEPFVNFCKHDYEKKFETERGKIEFILYLRKIDIFRKTTINDKASSFLQWLEFKLNGSKYYQTKHLPNKLYQKVYPNYFEVFEEYKQNKWWFSKDPVDLAFYQLKCLQKHNLWLTTPADFTDAVAHIFQKAMPHLTEEDQVVEATLFTVCLTRKNDEYNAFKVHKYKKIIENQKQLKDEVIDFERDVVIE